MTTRYTLPRPGTLARQVLLSAPDEYQFTRRLANACDLPTSKAGGAAHNLAERGLLEKEMVRGKATYKISELGKEARRELKGEGSPNDSNSERDNEQ